MANKYKLTKSEQETVIRSSAADQEWDVCTADPRFIRYLKRQGYEPVPDRQCTDYFSCRVPSTKVRIRKREIETSVERKVGLALGRKFDEVKPGSAQDRNGNETRTRGAVLVEG